MDDSLITTIDGPLATITFNRPDSLNAMLPDTPERATAFLRTVEARADVRCVVLRGAGGHFMAGADVKGFANIAGDTPAAGRRAGFEDAIHRMHMMIYIMRRMPQPVIASVAGAAAGIGMSFALASDLVVAGQSAFFTLAYIRIGLSPDGSSSYFLPRIVGVKKSMELALLGDRIDASEAERLGIVNRVVPDAELDDATAELAHRLTDGPPQALARTKRLIQESMGASFETQLQQEAVCFSQCAATDDWREGVSAFVEKRPPTFTGR